ncbi:MAG: hypothetical protein Q9O62_08115 [Ardenticatenia bacterium]|nr:hypothetical protein [Ardenticatenia bacterium]
MRLWIRWLTSLLVLLGALAAFGLWRQWEYGQPEPSPVLTFLSPYGLGTVGARFPVTVTLRQPDVVRVELWVNGQPVAAADNAIPSSAPWNLRLAWVPTETGPHTIFARLYMADGALVDTDLQTVEVVPAGAIAYVTVVQRRRAVVVSHTDGSARQVWVLGGTDPTWANEAVLFVARDGGIWGQGGPQARLQPIVPPAFRARAPAWQGRLAFTSRRGPQPQVLLRSREGDVTALPIEAQTSRDPTWDPAGRELIVAATREDNTDLYRVSLHTGEVRRLTDHPAVDHQPAWSPDGRVVLFVSERDGTPQVYWLALESGEPPVRVTDIPYGAERPAWSPDGTWFAYTAQLGPTPATRELVLQRLADNYAVRVTFNDVEDTWPAWRPPAR